MKRTLRAVSLSWVGLLLAVTLGSFSLYGQGQDPPNALEVFGVPNVPAEEQREAGDPLRGWEAFQYWRGQLDVLIVLSLSAFLAALIAYHPRSYGKATSLAELESPKTFLLYAVVGALVAIVVDSSRNPAMGLVVFGLGGLLRFRTDVGAAKDTGRVILVTIVGMACGLHYFAPAVVATVFGWILILLLEARPAFKITVKGLVILDGERQENRVEPSLKAYRSVLEKLGCRVIRERRNFIKGQFTFVFRAPRGLGPEDFEEHTRKEVAEELRGGVDWDST
jgi:hypothetical protein